MSYIRLYGHGWYTSGEFELHRIPEEILNKAVELGRACVARPHREKSVLFLLWQGLIAYQLHVGADAFCLCFDHATSLPPLLEPMAEENHTFWLEIFPSNSSRCR